MQIFASSEARAEFREGCRACLPLMVGGVPFGVTCGFMSVSAGFTPAEVVIMSLAVFSGSSQIVVASMMQAGNAALGPLMMNVFLVNLHNLLLMGSLIPHMRDLPGPLRGALSFGISDGTYAITMDRLRRVGYSGPYQAGASAVQFVFWIAANAAGALAGRHLPNLLAWGLDFAVTAVFIAILIPSLKSRISLMVCAAATIVALATQYGLGGKWHILAACTVAGTLGVWLEGRNSH